jgi:DNA-binding NarL/FixJ family response regulator
VLKEAALTSVRVLVADDHAAVLRSIARLLSTDFDVVGTVADGKALLEAVETTKPDVLVLDIAMPLVTGIEAAQILRERGYKGAIIFLTVHGDSELVAAARELGALGYVAKEQMLFDLPAAIKSALKGKRFISPTESVKN